MPDPLESASEKTALSARDYRFRRQGRSMGLAIALAAWLLVLTGLAIYAQASSWLMALLALPTLPGLYELGRNPRSGLDMNAVEIRWFTGSAHGCVPLSRVARVRLDTRLDLSVRATLVLETGQKLRLPPPATPPVDELIHACDSCGIPHERHHFSVF